MAVVVADSMPRLQPRWHGTFIALEWVFTVLFTVEYVARLVCLRHPLRYALSFSALWIWWPCCPPTWHCSSPSCMC